MTIPELHRKIADGLHQIEDVLPRQKWELTLVARYVAPGDPPLDADIVLTAGSLKDLQEVKAVITRFQCGHGVKIDKDDAREWPV